MAYNVFMYVRFSEHIRKQGDWSKEHRFFMIPIVLLVLFLIGYILIGLFGHPGLIMSGVLFGGSIFVLVMLLLIRQEVLGNYPVQS